MNKYIYFFIIVLLLSLNLKAQELNFTCFTKKTEENQAHFFKGDFNLQTSLINQIKIKIKNEQNMELLFGSDNQFFGKNGTSYKILKYKVDKDLFISSFFIKEDSTGMYVLAGNSSQGYYLTSIESNNTTSSFTSQHSCIKQ